MLPDHFISIYNSFCYLVWYLKEKKWSFIYLYNQNNALQKVDERKTDQVKIGCNTNLRSFAKYFGLSKGRRYFQMYILWYCAILPLYKFVNLQYKLRGSQCKIIYYRTNVFNLVSTFTVVAFKKSIYKLKFTSIVHYLVSQYLTGSKVDVNHDCYQSKQCILFNRVLHFCFL